MPVSILILNNDILSDTPKSAISSCNSVDFTIYILVVYLCISACIIKQIITLLILCIITIRTIRIYNKQLFNISIFQNIRIRSIWVDLPFWIDIFPSVYCNNNLRISICVICNYVTRFRCIARINRFFNLFRPVASSTTGNCRFLSSWYLITYVRFIYCYFTTLVYRILINLRKFS